MTLLDSALALAAKGFRVFPLAPLSKQPIFSSYHQKSTTDPAKIQGWWQHKTRTKNYNIGIHLPGTLVVDIDGPVGEESFQRLAQDHPCPPTAEVRTSCGRHLFYRLPDAARAIPRTLDAVKGFETYDKIDIKGSGGLVVGAGSHHKSGTTYAWVTEPATVADLTPAAAWMIQYLCGPEQPKYLQEISTDSDAEIEDANSDRVLLETCLVRWPFVAKEGAKRGSRHQQTGRVACWLLGRGVTQEKALALGERWLLAQGRDDDEAHSDLMRTLERAYKGLETGTTTLMIDHQQAAVDSYLTRFPGTGETERTRNALRVLWSSPSVLSPADALFLESLWVHVLYEVEVCGQDPSSIPMTFRQLKRVHELLHGEEHKIGGVKTLYKMLDQFVSMNDKRAKQVEVLVMMSKGRIGSSSVYACPPLSQHLVPKTLTGALHDYAARRGLTGVDDDVAGDDRVRPAAPTSAQQPAGGDRLEEVATAGALGRVAASPAGAGGVAPGDGAGAGPGLEYGRGLALLDGPARARRGQAAGRPTLPASVPVSVRELPHMANVGGGRGSAEPEDAALAELIERLAADDD